jgi:hypothetical protein
MTMSKLHAQVRAACPCPCFMSISILHIHVHPASLGPCPSCMSMPMLHVHSHAGRRQSHIAVNLYCMSIVNSGIYLFQRKKFLIQLFFHTEVCS